MEKRNKVVIREPAVYVVEDIPEEMTEEIDKCLAECEEATAPARKMTLSDLFSKLKR